MLQDVFGEVMEKVVVEDEADLQQLVGAEVVVCELSAKVLPRAAHLAGEPGDAPLLSGKLCFNEVSSVWCFIHNKGVNPFSFRLSNPKVSPNTCCTDKQKTVHAIWREPFADLSSYNLKIGDFVGLRNKSVKL